MWAKKDYLELAFIPTAPHLQGQLFHSTTTRKGIVRWALRRGIQRLVERYGRRSVSIPSPAAPLLHPPAQQRRDF